MSARTAFSLVSEDVIQGDAVFARDRTLRCELRRWWVERPKRWAAWLMLNPSDAGEQKNDPTMHRVIRFTRSWGYDGCIVVNINPFISSDPAAMWQWAKWEANGPDYYARDDMQSNLGDIERVGRMSCLRMVAFGAAPALKDELWLEQCIEAFGQPFDYPESGWSYIEQLHCLGVTNSGQPLHPLARGKMRVPDCAQPIPWMRKC